MQIPDLYCEDCGAANPREAMVCFACQQPLKFLPESPGPDPFSRAEMVVQTPPALLKLHLNLSSGSLTMIEIEEQPPGPPLLHGRYQVLSKVGTGGFGAVYKARDTLHGNRMVAIKVIELDTLSASQAIEATDTFNRELNLLSNLDHPHLPGIHEHFIDARHWYLVMDFIAGEPLDEYLAELDEATLPLKEVTDIGLQLCEVLRYLHELEPPIIFRDVKPGNIIRTPGGHLYLIDFGIARRFKPGQARDTTPLGSPGFAAPEQYGRAQTTARSDIYGLGATLYYLLTGYDPADTPFNLPPVTERCPTLPEPLARLLTTMLALDPDERPASIAAVQQILVNYVPLAQRSRTVKQLQGALLPPLKQKRSAPAVSTTRPRRLSAFLKGLFSVF